MKFLALLALAGCASSDDLRIVQPVQWHDLDRVDLALMCRDVSEKLKGCVVSRFDGDHIYLLRHE